MTGVLTGEEEKECLSSWILEFWTLGYRTRYWSCFPGLSPAVMRLVGLGGLKTARGLWTIEDGCGCGWAVVHEIVVESEETRGGDEGSALFGDSHPHFEIVEFCVWRSAWTMFMDVGLSL